MVVVFSELRRLGKINYEPDEWVYRRSHGQTEINPTHTAILVTLVMSISHTFL